MTSIIYRVDKYTLLDHEIGEFSYAVKDGEDSNIWILSCAALQEKNGEEKFMVINTHERGKGETEIKEGIEIDALEHIYKNLDGFHSFKIWYNCILNQNCHDAKMVR